MSDKVQKALRERAAKKRDKEQKEEYSFYKESRDKVDNALENRKKRIQSNAGAIALDIQERYNSAIDSYNDYLSNNSSLASGTYSEGINLKSVLDDQRERNLAVSKLIRDIEAYRSYLGDDIADKMLAGSTGLREKYKGILTNAQTFSQYKTKEEYDAAVEYNKLVTETDADKLKAEIDELEARRATADETIGTLEQYWTGAIREDGHFTTNMQDVPIFDSIYNEMLEKGYGDKAYKMAEEEFRNRYLDLNSKKIQSLAGYKSLEEMDADIYAKREIWGQVRYYQEGVKLSNEALNAEDFDVYAEKGASIENPSFGEAKLPGKMWGTNIVNKVEFARENEDKLREQIGLADSNDDILIADAYLWYTEMTPKEVSIYNYYLAKYGEEKADEYLYTIEDSVNHRIGSKTAELYKDNTFLQYLHMIPAGIDQANTGFANALNNSDKYVPTSSTKYASQDVRESIGEKHGVIGTTIYDLGTTTFNMVPSIAVGTVVGAVNPVAGAAVGSGLMGLSAKGNAYVDKINAGWSVEQAQTYSTIVGVSESCLQFALGGIGKLGGTLSGKVISKAISGIDNAAAKFVLNFGGHMAAEGIEEGLQSFLEPFYENAALGYAKNGLEDVDWGQVTYDALLGALAGGIFEGGGAVVNKVGNHFQNVAQGYSIMDAEGGVEALTTLGADTIKTSTEENSRLIKAYDKVAGKKVKASNVGRLYRAVEGEISSQNKADIVKSLERKGFSSKESSSIAEAIVAQSSGQTLTKEQAKLVESLKGDERIAKTLNDVVLNEDSTVGQRTADLSMFDMGIANGVGVSPNIQQTEKNIATKSLKNEVAKVLEDKKIEVADDGKTTNLKTNKAVEIKNIESISKSGEVNLTLDDKTIIKASDVAFGSEAEALFIGNIGSIKIGNKNISTASANALYQNAMTALKANPNMTATEAMSLIKGLEESYIYGAYNLSKEKLSSKNKDGSATMFAGELTQSQRDSAYELGSQDKVSKVEADQKVIDGLKAKGKPSKKSLGKVIFEDGANVDESTLTATQKANLNGIKLLAELSSVEFHIFKSEKVGKTFKYAMPDGTVVSANGWYVAGTNEIWVDLNAGNFGEGTMIRTAAHEISHYIKQWSPKKWQAMADLLMEEFAKNGVNTESMLNRQIAKIKRRYSKENMPSEAKLLDMAYEELVSDALSDMLTDGSIVNFMAEVKAKDRTLWQKIKDAIENLLKKWGLIIEDYKGRSLDTAEAQALSQLEDTFKKLQAMYQEAFIDANEAVATIGARNLADFAEAKNTEGESLFQYRAMEADEATYREMLRKWGKMSDAQINNLFTTIDKAMDIIKDNLEVLDYAWESDIDDRAFSPVKPNSDSLYQVSLDFSTLCRKRLLQQTIQAQLQEALNQPLTREEGIAIRDALVALQEEGRQIEVACALCYVESARMKSPAQIKKFLNNREKVLKDFFAGKSGGTMKAKIDQAVADAREKLHKENPNGIKGKDGSMLDPRTAPLKAMSGKYANTIRDAKKAAKESYKPTAKEQELIDIAKDMTVSDFTTPEGLENLAKNYPALFDAYTSYVRNATKSKGIEGDTWWRAGDSQNIGDVLIANMNRENGLRSQSWSDFQVIHILDYIAATIELSTRNAKEQAYSKVPDYVELMGQTGVMINMSLIPTRDFNGKLEYDPTEGIDYNRALALREKYPATAGTICIGIDNKQIQMLLADINIDYVIPYHKSGMAASVRKLMHMPTWSEYEDYQSEKNLSRADAEAQAKKYGVTLLAESDPNYHKQTSFSEWFNLKEAKQIAKKENAKPSNKAMQEKYGVMYGGYVAMQNAANNYLKLCAERGISPKFSHEKADFTSEDNYWKLLIDRKMVNNATGEIIEQQAIKPIFDEGEVLRILNDELERYPSVKADQDYATRKVTEKFLSGEIKSGMSAETIAKVMKTPVDNITKTNILASEREIRDFDSSEERIAQNIRDVAKMSSVYDVDKSKLEKTGKKPSDIFTEHFDRWGNQLYSDELGDIAVEKSSVKSEIRHGITAEKIASIEAIPTVIKEGKIIFTGMKPNSDVQRIVVCAPIKIGGTPYYMGVMLQRDTQSQRLYLHNVAIEKEASEISQADLLTTGADENNEYLFMTSILQNAMSVKYQNGIDAQSDKNSDASDKLFSDRDSSGRELSKGQQKYFAKSKVRDRYGNLLRLFHGSAQGGFTIFDPKKSDDDLSLFFTDTIEMAESYSGSRKSIRTPSPKPNILRWLDRGTKKAGKQQGVYEVYANITNPMIIEAKGRNFNQLSVDAPNTKDVNLKVAGYENDMRIEITIGKENYVEYFYNFDEAMNFVARKLDKGERSRLKAAFFKGGFINIDTSFKWDTERNQRVPYLDIRDIAKIAKERGHDGVIVRDVTDYDNRYGIPEKTPLGTVVVAFKSNQIKDVHNTNPTKRKDIRYSDRDTSTSNRSILANSLESAAQNDIERNKLAQYKEKIALIESEEQRLSEIQKQLFTKGGVDPSQRKDLQFEAKQIANRINTYDRQLLNLEATTALKNVLSREKALAMKRQKQKDAEAMRQYKEKVAKTTRELMDRHQESRKKAIEGREKTAMRHKIQKVVSELNTLLLKGSKERNVKLGLQESVAKALEVVNMDTVGADERVAKYDALIAKATNPDVITSLTETRDRIKQQGENLAEKLEAMRNAYAEIRRNSNNDYAQYYQQEAELIEYVIEDVIKKVGNTSIRDMSLSQLEAVYNMYKVVLQTIQYANKLYTEGKVEELRKNASDMMAELKKIKTLKEERAALGDKFREFSWNELIPIYAVRRTGSKVLEKFFWETIKGQSTFARDLDEADVFKSAIREKYGHSKWDLNKVHEFKLKDGRTFRLTLEHMMSIYAYSKRAQALDHMTEGGFFFNDKATFRRKGGVLEIVKSNEVGYAIDQDILNEITATMEKEAKGSIQYVDEMQDYLTKMGEKGNEVSRVVWGIDIFKEKIYFPLKSSKDFIFQANQPVQETSLKHDGMTKETKPGASNPIILEAFDEVWSNHVIRMSQYHGFVIPIDNMNKLLNYGSWAGTDSISVSTMLRARFSEAVNEYFNQFIKDMNGASSTSGATNPFFSFVGKFKKTAVAASMSVVAQQPTAILRAMAVMNPKYFAGLPKARRLSTVWSEMRKYAPIATIKEIGGFEMGGGRTAAEWLNSDTKRGVDRVSNKIDDITMKGAAIGDQIGWCAIWEAVKREIKDTTNLKEGTEEFLQRVGERATEVIVLTQVYDSTLSRSGYMRSKHDSVKMLTSFLGEPTVSLNMMQDATLQAKRKTISKARAGRIIGATYASVIAASVAASLIYALRDDDDDESYAEKFAEAFGGKILGDINPLNMLPGIRDIFSIFDGWDVERTDVAIFKDIKDAFDGLFSENKSPWRKVEDFAGAISSVFGIPGKNLLRTGREIYNGITNIFDDITPSRVGDAFIRGITGEKKDKGEALYNAIINGDDARLGVYRKGYKDDKAYESAVRSALRENDPRIKEAAEARIDGDIAEYTRIVKAIKGEGNFVQDTIVAAVNAEINALNKGEDSSSSSDKAKSMYTMDDYFMALDGGDEATAYVVKEDLIQTDVANGKDREEAEESFVSKFTSRLREQYEEGGISDYEAQRMLVDYGDKTEEEAASKVQYWEFKQEYPDYDDLSEEAVDKYYTDIEPYGITVDVYYDYSKQRSKCKGVDANGDGKTDSGSKKAEIMQVINSLPISRSQKDVLYYLNGWSAKTIYEAPWH